MAKVQHLKVAGVAIIETDGKTDWARFKNTPATIVSASGHDHNATYYTTSESNAKFAAAEATLANIQAQIDALAIKYTGYIGGGASASNHVNRYTTTNETRSDLGAVLSHSPLNAPGMTSKEQGYIFNSNKTTTKYVYSTNTAVNVTATPKTPLGTLFDYAIQTKGFVTDGASGWATIEVLTDTWTTLNNATSNAAGRPLLSSSVEGFTKSTGTSMSYKYDYIKGTSSETISFTVNGTPTGMVRSSAYGYWVANTDSIYKHSYSTNSVAKVPSFTVHFSNTNTISTEYNGYALSGSNHSSAQKLNWASETVSTAGSVIDLTGGACIEY